MSKSVVHFLFSLSFLLVLDKNMKTSRKIRWKMAGWLKIRPCYFDFWVWMFDKPLAILLGSNTFAIRFFFGDFLFSFPFATNSNHKFARPSGHISVFSIWCWYGKNSSFAHSKQKTTICLFVECKKKSACRIVVCVTNSLLERSISFTRCQCVDFNIERTNSKKVPEHFELQSNFGSFIFVLLSLMFQWQYKKKRKQFAVTRIRPRKKHTNDPHNRECVALNRTTQTQAQGTY